MAMVIRSACSEVWPGLRSRQLKTLGPRGLGFTVPVLGVPSIRIIVLLDLYWGPLFWETTRSGCNMLKTLRLVRSSPSMPGDRMLGLLAFKPFRV